MELALEKIDGFHLVVAACFARERVSSLRKAVKTLVVLPLLFLFSVTQHLFFFCGTEFYKNRRIFLRLLIVFLVDDVIVYDIGGTRENVCMYGHTYSKSMDQPGKVANPARGQLNREKWIFLCPCSRLRIWSRETRSSSQSRPASACSSPYSGGIWCLLTVFRVTY